MAKETEAKKGRRAALSEWSRLSSARLSKGINPDLNLLTLPAVLLLFACFSPFQ